MFLLAGEEWKGREAGMKSKLGDGKVKTKELEWGLFTPWQLENYFVQG